VFICVYILQFVVFMDLFSPARHAPQLEICDTDFYLCRFFNVDIVHVRVRCLNTSVTICFPNKMYVYSIR
jgi:hypothetical protein